MYQIYVASDKIHLPGLEMKIVVTGIHVSSDHNNGMLVM